MKRRILSVISVIMLFTMNGGLVNAETVNTKVEIIDIMPEGDYSEQNNHYTETGEKVIKSLYGTRAVLDEKYLSFSHYYQETSPWGDDFIGTSSKTIADVGCALTSFTMITDYYGFNDDPGEVNIELGSSAYLFDYTSAASSYSLTLSGSVHYSVTDSYAINYIIGAISDNKPVQIGMAKGSSTHFVTAEGYQHGYDSSGEYFRIYIKDPLSARDYDYLSDYFDAGWYVNRIKVYE